MSRSTWPSLALIGGGLLMIPMWLRYTSLHGPTSVDRDGHWLGQGPGFWGSMMAPASLLIVAGLYGHRASLAPGGRAARSGLWLALIGLGIPAVADLSIREVIPPLLMPLAAVGLILLGAARRDRPLPLAGRVALAGTGMLLGVAFLMNAIPLETLDTFQWYRVYGVLSNVLLGAGMAVLGVSVARCPATEAT